MVWGREKGVNGLGRVDLGEVGGFGGLLDIEVGGLVEIG